MGLHKYCRSEGNGLAECLGGTEGKAALMIDMHGTN